jgi:putative membrane protein
MEMQWMGMHNSLIDERLPMMTSANPPEMAEVPSPDATTTASGASVTRPGGGERRLHLATLWLPAIDALVGLAVPAVIAFFFVGPLALLWGAGCFVLLPTALFHAIRYFTVIYQIDAQELVIRSGVISRRERRIPLDRIQEVKIHQGVLHQVLALAKVDLSTAGKDAQEAGLNVLTLAEADELKSLITSRQRATDPSETRCEPNTETTPEFLFALDFKTLWMGGFTSKVVATLGAIISAILYFQLFVRVGGDLISPVGRKIEGRLDGKIPEANPEEVIKELTEKLPDFGPFGFVADLFLNETLANSVMLALAGLVFTVLAYVVRYFRFQLERRGDMLSTSHGLLNLQHGSLARNRIQALKLEEALLRRWLGLASIHVDSAGDRHQVDENKQRELLLPVARRPQAVEVARQAIPGLVEFDPSWNRISRRAIRRGSNKGWLLASLVMLQTMLVAGWFCLIWIPAFPLIYLLNYQWYRHSGYWIDDDYFLWRSGWINRSTVCLPVTNVQNVAVTQNPFDRRLGLASMSVDIAGQSNTGGGPRIKHLPLEEAQRIQHQLAARADESEFVW